MKLWYLVALCALVFKLTSLSAQTAGTVDSAQSGSLTQNSSNRVQYGPQQEATPGDEQANIAQPVQKKLDTLYVEGLSINQILLVKNSVTLKVGSEIRPQDIAESIRKLHALGLFRTIDFFVHSETDSSAKLILKLTEYPICENVEYAGNKKLKQKDFDEKIIVKRGQVISDASTYDIVQQLKRFYAEKGYNLAEVTPELIPTKVPGNAILKLQIKEGPKVRIKAIVFAGNKDVKASRLERKFKTKANRWWRSGDFKEELYKEHIDSLIFFYNDLGYLDASVTKDSVYYGQDKKDMFIQVTIDEGKKYFAGDFYFNGNRVIPTDSLQSRITLKKGKPFQKSRYEMSKYMVENVYREEGYLWVGVDEKRSFRNDTIDITFQITEGRAAIVRKVDITGNSKTLEKVIRREIDLLPGKKYKQSLMMRSRQNIMSLNFFSDVKPDLVPNEDGTIDLVFEIVEKDNIGQLQVGAAYSGSGFVGTFATTIPNFRGTGQQLGVNVEFGGRERANLSLSFSEPWAFDKPMSLSGKVFYSMQNISRAGEDERTQNYGFEMGVGRQQLKWPDSKFRVYGTYGFSWNQTTYDEQTFDDLNLKIMSQGFKNSFGVTVRRYDLDIPMFATEGSDLSFSSEYVGFGVGKQYQFFKATAEYQHYFPLPYKFVIGSRTKVGAISGLGSQIKITHDDLFRLGGVWGMSADLRGYEEYVFGGFSSNPQSGLNMFASTLELRYPLLDQQLYIGAFADVGNTWSRVSDMNLGDLYKGVGVGIRVNLPMLGMLGVDFAWGLDDLNSNWMDKKPSGFRPHFLMNKGF